jgi:tetratricopeptide (TPR) repeat protein
MSRLMSFPGRRIPPVRFCLLAVGFGLTALAATRAVAQFGERGIPTRTYHDVFPIFYEGDYKNALDGFKKEGRGCVKVGQLRWIDSICYETMVGECYYEIGNFDMALEHYNNALQLYLQFPNWMVRVQFPTTIRVSSRRVAVPWISRPPQGKFGHYPETMLIMQGEIDLNDTVKRGGVVQKATLYPIEVQEIVRCTALAIRRRASLVGPMGSQDELNERLIKAMSHAIGPPNHWSEAWTNLQLGLAYSAAGREGQAVPLLQRATLAAGEFEHPLTSTAHLELGRLAMLRGDYPIASQHFEEASYAAVFYADPGVLEEAFRYGLVTHFLANRQGLFAPLTPAVQWAKVNKLRQLHSSLLLLGAENYATLGQTQQAGKLLDDATLMIGRRTMLQGRMGARRNYLAALVFYQQGKVNEGDAALTAAMAYLQKGGSFWLYYIASVDTLFKKLFNVKDASAAVSSKALSELYQDVLRDPRPKDWGLDPMEALAVLTMRHRASYENWFSLAWKRKEYDIALEIADRVRRHAFFVEQVQDLGGRVQSLRWVLEGPVEMLDAEAQNQRQDLLTRYRGYDQLRQQAAALRKKLAAMPLAPEDQDVLKQQAQGLAQLATVGRQQEAILREMAVRREGAVMVFPPLKTTAQIQRWLPKGQALLVFFAHKSTGRFYVFLLNSEKSAAWEISKPTEIFKLTSALLHDMGSVQANYEISVKELRDPKWKETSRKMVDLLQQDRMDLGKKFDELIIVPDGALWYLPFEALQVQSQGKTQPLIARARIRYVPTASMAMGPPGWNHRPATNTAVVLGHTFPKQKEEVVQAAFDELAKSLPGCVALKPPVASPSAAYATLLDRLVVFDEVNVGLKGGSFGWSPLPAERGKTGGTLQDWIRLPWGGPDEVVLPAFHTWAEESLDKTARESAGNEVFLSVCGLMASGTRTALFTRWRTGGQTNFDLVREFTQELPHTPPAEAWQRAVLLLARSPLNLEAEPRVKGTADESMRASHPFFWAGYMLVDSASPGADAEPAGPGPAPGPVIKIKPGVKPAPPKAEDGPEKPEVKPEAEKPTPPKVEKPRPKAVEEPEPGPRLPKS